MEKLAKTVIDIFPGVCERTRFFASSSIFFLLSGAILYLLLVATYPPIHDAVHDLRHALAVVPCH